MKPAALLVASGAALVGLLTPMAASAATPGTSYVALGDSFSAGVGTRYRVDACYRSPEGYPALVAQARGLSLSYQACTRATLVDVQNTQLGTLSASTGYVTVSGGGNDAGFTSGLLECAKPGWLSNCPGKLASAETAIATTIPARLDSLYADIRARAPQAVRVAVAYPHLFNGTDCNALTFFSPWEQTRINALTDQLDDLTRTKAVAHGMGFVDPRAAFAGHAVCDSQPFLNGPTLPVDDSYHPNDAGNRAYAGLVDAAFGTPATTTVLAAASLTAEPSAAEYAAVLPDLASEENLARAEAAGIPRGQIVRLDRQLRSHDKAQQKQAMAELKRLDRQVEARNGR